MTSKEELAAIMASDGDYERKISLLKKAVVSVTRQKQEAEAQAAQLQEELKLSQVELQRFREENLSVNRKLLELQAELERERKAGNFGHHMLKGLSSLVTGGDGGPGNNNGGGGAPPVRRKGKQALSLSSEDVERVVKENENLLMQMYTLKNAHDDVEKLRRTESERHKVELGTAQKETVGLRSLLDTTTKVCDTLNSENTKQRALVQFCLHFFRIALRGDTNALEMVMPTDVPQPLPRDTTDEAVKTIAQYCATVTTLLHAVSVLLASLRESLPRAQRATVGDVRCFIDRLTTLAEAHSVEKESLLYSVQHLESLVRAVSDTAEHDNPHSDVDRTQRDIVEGIQRWVALIRGHIPLLVDSCVSFLPRGQTFRLTVLSGDDGTQREYPIAEREVFVEEVVSCLFSAMSSVEGSIEALRGLLESSEALTASHHGSVEMLLAMQQFWWEGTRSLPVLRDVSATLSAALEDIAAGCQVVEVSNAISHISKQLRRFAPEWRQSRALTGAGRRATPPLHGAGTSTSGTLALTAPGLVGSSSTPNSWSYVEVLSALSAADRAAVCYYTQMNTALTELADKEDALSAMGEELRVAQQQLGTCKTEAERTREAMQEQIQLLSNQLIGHTNHS